ncbi:hypothetical protein AVEN_91930-1 [Araneus ventricosus]|uniref:Uncharacterized protein n=1 Tax=Araneus ventricosus TaxID=182803 RepID=A0A4Y2JFM7_ARAVE|nr:hypothetical protein AVEN_91930-1 [Araneus ventricosus]
MSGINMDEYLKAGDDLMVSERVTEEDILSEITDEMKNDDEEDDDSDPSQSLLTSQDDLQSAQFLRSFFSSLSSTNDDYFRAVDYKNLLS